MLGDFFLFFFTIKKCRCQKWQRHLEIFVLLRVRGSVSAERFALASSRFRKARSALRNGGGLFVIVGLNCTTQIRTIPPDAGGRNL